MTFQEMLENEGYKTRSYSGRGMFGKECLAITIDSDSLLYSLLEIGYMCSEFNIEIPSSVSYDTMGRNNYVIYFRGIEYKDTGISMVN